MPGIINAIGTFIIFDSFFTEIDLGAIVDSYKSISNDDFRFEEKDGQTLKEQFVAGVLPFLGFLYLSAFMIGVLSGRFVRLTRLDTKWKLLRFKNQWFYLFNGYHKHLRKYQGITDDGSQDKEETYLFTQADILIDSNEGALLYSGIIVDYELQEREISELSKIILRNASRYKQLENQKRVNRPIPGNFYVVDCRNLLNLNLTFVYGRKNRPSPKKAKKIVYRIFAFLCVLIIPLLIFKLKGLNWSLYEAFFELTWLGRFFYYLVIIQIIQLLNPFVEDKTSHEYRLVKWQEFLGKVLLVGFTLLLAFLVEGLSQWLISFI